MLKTLVSSLRRSAANMQYLLEAKYRAVIEIAMGASSATLRLMWQLAVRCTCGLFAVIFEHEKLALHVARLYN
jgi:hypothetical protein